jgi:hypothetical protein
MRRLTKKKYLVAGTAVAVAASGGIAFAYWTSTGSGNGSATTGTSTDWLVAVEDVSLGDLTPGGPTDTVGFKVTNPGTGVQNLNGTVASVTGTSNPGCTAADFAVGTTSDLSGDFAAGQTKVGSFTVQMVDTGVNQDACKNVTVDLEVVAN